MDIPKVERVDFRPRNYTPLSLMSATREFRADRDDALTNSVFLGGSKGEDLLQLVDSSQHIAEQMEKVHSEWIHSHVGDLTDYFDPVNHDDVSTYHTISKAFKQQLPVVITQQYRLYKKIFGEVSKNDFTGQGLEDRIAASALNFFQILRLCQRNGVDPSTALRIAKKGHWFNPEKLHQLRSNPKYDDLTDYVKEYALIGYPKKPEEYLDGILETLTRLRTIDEFSLVDKGVLIRAATDYPKNPEKYLRDYIEVIRTIRANPKYSNLPDFIVKAAAKNTVSAEKFLDRFINTVELLTRDPRYEDIPDYVIVYTAYKCKDVEAALQRYQKNVELLRVTFRENPYPDSLYSQIAIGRPEDPISYFNELKATVDALISDPKYSGLTQTEIRSVVTYNHSNPRQVLDRFITLRARLESDPRFKDVPPSTIKKFLLFRSTDTDPVRLLSDYVNLYNRLSQNPRYQNLPRTVISQAVNRTNNPESFLDRFMAEYAKVRADVRFKEISDSVLLQTVAKQIKDPELFLTRFLEASKDLKSEAQYSELPDWVISLAIRSYSADPKKFLNEYLAGKGGKAGLTEQDAELLIDLEDNLPSLLDDNEQEEGSIELDE